MMKQSHAVLHFTKEVLGNDFRAGVAVASYVTKEQRAQIVALVTASILAGDVAFSDKASAKYDTEAKIKGYVGGMVKNWFEKSKALNGGGTYAPKNPGSRAGSTDPQIRELRKLLGQLQATGRSEDDIALVQASLDARLAEVEASKPASAKKKVIDANSLPEDLRHLVA